MEKCYSKQEYAKAYTELIEILKNLPQEEVDKIPKEEIDMYISNKDNEYNYKLNNEKSLEEQSIMHLTQILIANLYIQYWATDEEKEKIRKEEEEYFKKQEEKKRAIYSNDVFSKQQGKEIKQEKSLIMVEEKNILERIINKIKQWLKLT